MKLSRDRLKKNQLPKTLDLAKYISIDDLIIIKRTILQSHIYSKWSTVDLLFNRIQNTHTYITCPLCSHKSESIKFKQLESHCIFGGGHLLRHICPDCEVVFGPKKMIDLSPEELSEDYEWHYSAYDEGDTTERELRTFFALNPIKNGVYLNYGAGGWSNSVSILRSQGWNVYAYEPHTSATQIQGGDKTWNIRLASQLSQMKFDGIYSNNVLEHFRHPIKELKNMSLLLKIGGLMSHATPCFEYSYEYTRFHLFFFVGKSKHYLFQQANLRLKEEIIDGDYVCCVLELGYS